MKSRLDSKIIKWARNPILESITLSENTNNMLMIHDTDVHKLSAWLLISVWLLNKPFTIIVMDY